MRNDNNRWPKLNHNTDAISETQQLKIVHTCCCWADSRTAILHKTCFFFIKVSFTFFIYKMMFTWVILHIIMRKHGHFQKKIIVWGIYMHWWSSVATFTVSWCFITLYWQRKLGRGVVSVLLHIFCHFSLIQPRGTAARPSYLIWCAMAGQLCF